ncbi:MAG: hypothetical protein M1827_004334 [Pycnora praestabilis]|nr:MAG: hypothetical protein M1827_004334 [Pycnora praestabilis]
MSNRTTNPPSATLTSPISPPSNPSTLANPYLATSATRPISPAELDGSPIYPTTTTEEEEDGDDQYLGRKEAVIHKQRRGSSAEPGVDSDVYEELSGEKGMGRLWVEERAQIRAAKSKDPAVVVNIPNTPAAQDYEVAAQHPEKPEGFRPGLPTSESASSLITAGKKGEES